jgi:hypothetical protein
VVNCAGRDREHCEGGKHREEWHEQKYGALGKRPSDRSGHGCDGNIPGVVEGGVSPHSPGQLPLSIDTEGDRCDCRTKDIPNDVDGAIGSHYDPEGRHHKNRHRSYGKNGQGYDDERPLGMGCVDDRTDQGLHGETKPPARHGDQTDARLAPMLLRDEEHVEVWPQCSAHIGEQEVQRIERGRMKASRLSLGRD